MSDEIEIPKGWRKLEPQELIELSDMVLLKDSFVGTLNPGLKVQDAGFSTYRPGELQFYITNRDLKKDIARYNELAIQMRQLINNTEALKVWQEMESIKNKYNGNVPKA